MPTLRDTLAWLVDIPSETGNEAGLRDAIADRLAGLPLTPVRESLVVGDPGPGKVILAGHIDTVPLQGHVGARIEGGRMFGLGATDMKGGLAVMIHLMEDLGEDHLVAVFYAGEEGPLSGNQLGPVFDEVPELAAADAGVVLEPTNRGVDAGCQGSMNATVSFLGDAAHSARPWFGENAITKAGAFLRMMHELGAESHIVEGLEFKEVMSVTRATGGVANNIIPGRFDINVNYRFAPDRSIEDATEHIHAVCADADEVEIADIAPAAYPDVAHPLFRRLIDVSGGVLASKQGWTDVAQLAHRGIPSVNFGPGETALAHKPGESVRLDDLDWAYDALYEALSSG